MINNELVVTTPTASYPVVIGPGVLDELPRRLRALNIGGMLWLVSDSKVYPIYGRAIEAALREAGYSVSVHVVPDGEASKDQATLGRLYNWMLGGGVERRDCLLALGGGVVGDLAGFAAASVLRGIALVQLPTTLQAMVDAAVGGKTGINHSRGKNLIGAFHQPRLVLGDTNTLRTLPERELRAGWAEVIKHGVIRDAGLFELLEAYANAGSGDREANAQSSALGALIQRAVAVKVAVVSNDERESGERVILNYGHTLGHALELATGYGTLLHGEAVSIGMHAAARIARRLHIFSANNVERQRRLLEAFGLPIAFPPGIDVEALLEISLHDKKVQARRVRWVLPTTIGQVVVRDDVPQHVVADVIREQA
jgi:3-dehydroquinate synthase